MHMEMHAEMLAVPQKLPRATMYLLLSVPAKFKFWGFGIQTYFKVVGHLEQKVSGTLSCPKRASFQPRYLCVKSRVKSHACAPKNFSQTLVMALEKQLLPVQNLFLGGFEQVQPTYVNLYYKFSNLESRISNRASHTTVVQIRKPIRIYSLIEHIFWTPLEAVCFSLGQTAGPA